MKRIFIVLIGGLLMMSCSKKEPVSLEPKVNDAAVAGKSSAPAAKKAAPAPEKTAPAANAKEIPVNKDSVMPCTLITKKGVPLTLFGTPLQVGNPFPTVTLVNAANGDTVQTDSLKGKVVIFSVIPSVTTPVCNAQSTYLENKGADLNSSIARITVSRDAAAVLQRFAENATDSQVMYLSDATTAAFGPATGLAVEGKNILARAVIVVDPQGIVRHLQVVPEVTQLPDLDKAFEVAVALTESKE